MNRECSKCHHECHCGGQFHTDEHGMCPCEECDCRNKADDKTYENEIKNGD